jgi:hypothetical protein
MIKNEMIPKAVAERRKGSGALKALSLSETELIITTDGKR